MAVTDYSETAASNLTLGTISVAEQMARGDVNDAFRQLMADVKTESVYTRAELASLLATATSYPQTYPNAYASALPRGVTGTTSLVGGSGGTNGTFALGVAGGSITGVAGTFTVAGGALTSITITNPGLGSGTTPPTLSFTASSGLTGASATAVVGSLIDDQESYWAASSDSNYIELYKNNSGSVAEVNNADGSQIAMPNSNALDGALASLSPWENYSSLATYPDLGKLKALQLFGAAGADLYVSDFFRDNAAGARFNLVIKDSGGSVAGVQAGGGAIDPTGYTGLRWVPIVELNSSGITGAALVDFDAGGLWSGTGYTSPTTDLSIATTQLSDAESGNIEAIAETQALAVVGLYGDSPFTASATDEYARALFHDVKIEGGDPGHDYYLNYETLLIGGTPNTYRVRFRIWDDTLGEEVARFVKQDSTDWTTTMSETVFLSQVDQGTPLNDGDPTIPYMGITATVWVNWSEVLWTKTLTTYTDMVATGLLDSCVISNAEMNGFLLASNPKRFITVGASGCDFTSVVDAVESLYDADIASPTYSDFPVSNSCSYSNQVLVQVIDADWSEDLAGLVVPDYCTIRGLGPGNTVFTATATGGGTPRVMETTFSCRIENCTLRQNGTGYVVHIDNNNGLSIPATDGPAYQRFFIRQVFKNVRFEGSSSTAHWMAGTGISNGQHILFDECVFEREGTSTVAAIGVHNSPSTTLPGTVHIRNCVFNDQAITGAVAVQLLTSYAQSHPHRIIVENSELGEISYSNTAGGADGWVRSGRIDSSITYPSDLDPL